MDEHEQPQANLIMESMSMLCNDTWFNIPFDLPFNVLYMLGTMGMITIEVSVYASVKLSVYINETTVTAVR